MTRTIPLTKGYNATVDDVDYETVSQYNWHAKVQPNGNAHAARQIRVNPHKQKALFLHQFLMTPPAGLEVDHIDGNALNCVRANMRLCTHAENCKNKGVSRNNKSGYKGVHWDKSGRSLKKWRASICVDYKTIRLGRFADALSAAKAYDVAAKFYYGQFARTNF